MPDGGRFADRYRKWKVEEAQEKQEAAAQDLVKAPRAKRSLPPGLCQASPVTSNTPLASPLLDPVGRHDPRTVGATLP